MASNPIHFSNLLRAKLAVLPLPLATQRIGLPSQLDPQFGETLSEKQPLICGRSRSSACNVFLYLVRASDYLEQIPADRVTLCKVFAFVCEPPFAISHWVGLIGSNFFKLGAYR